MTRETAATPAKTEHHVSIEHEGPRKSPGFSFGGGHRASCSCGWWSDCYAMLSDTERAIEVHLRRAKHEPVGVQVRANAMDEFRALIARSSIGQAIADIKKRGIDAHLVDLERETSKRWRRRTPRPRLSAEDQAFMRGFGTALASIWRCQHDGQMVRQLIRQNNFTLASFRDVGLLPADYAAIKKAAGR